MAAPTRSCRDVHYTRNLGWPLATTLGFRYSLRLGNGGLRQQCIVAGDNGRPCAVLPDIHIRAQPRRGGHWPPEIRRGI